MDKNEENCDNNNNNSEMRRFTPVFASAASMTSSVPPPKKANLSTNGGGASSSSSSSSSAVDRAEAAASGGSESMWMPQSDKLLYLQTRLIEGADPRSIIQSMASSGSTVGRSSRYASLFEMIPSHVGPEILWRFLFEIFSEPSPRPKLPHVNTLDDVVNLIKGAHKILVVAGAGLSVSCGIPDFRSKDGLYSLVAKEFPELSDPQMIFDADFFKENPRPFFRFAKNLYCGGMASLRYQPSPAHRFLTELEKRDKLLRVFTQNIDGLEIAAGLSYNRVIACHGSFETSTCTECRRKIDSTEIADHINNGTVAMCNKGGCSGILKPDIVFFGESLPPVFHHQMAVDRSQADLVIVLGTSLRVRPVSLIPHAIAPQVPQILINRERLRHMNFDVELLGDCDVVVKHLRAKLGWNEEVPPAAQQQDSSATTITTTTVLPSFAFYPPNTYIFASSIASSPPPLQLSDDDEDESESDSESDSAENNHLSHSSESPPQPPPPKRVLVKVRPDPPKEESSTNTKEQQPSKSDSSKPTSD